MSIEKRLLNKKDFIKIIEENNINDVREIFKLTHIIDNQYKNFNGYCYSCLKPLRPDYQKYKNYCMDC